MTTNLVSTLILFLTIMSCSVSKNTSNTSNLQSLMSGSYDSSNQASLDSSFYDITLNMNPIWTDKYPGRYLYVEQAVTSTQDRPYRQRVYELIKDNDLFISRVYELPDPDKAIGANYSSHSIWTNLSPEDLTIREGCDVILKKTGPNIYSGSTVEKNCKSSLRGASYATSEVTLDPSGITSWDRGYDSIGNQVWGAEKSGYRFDRK